MGMVSVNIVLLGF